MEQSLQRSDNGNVEGIVLYSHGESNPNRWNRNPLFYPLNYESILMPYICKGNNFFDSGKSAGLNGRDLPEFAGIILFSYVAG